jgi:ATP-dependent Clp protease protease subunit
MDLSLTIEDRNIFLSDQITQDSVSSVIEKIITINESDEYFERICSLHGFGLTHTRKPIKIYIDSYGGSVYQCLGLISVMERSQTPIHTICTGVAMSAGFMILIFGHKRFAHKYSTPLYHQASSFVFGELKNIEENIAEMKRLQDLLETLVLEKTDIKKTRLKQVYVEKLDWYLTAKEALENNVIDEILD